MVKCVICGAKLRQRGYKACKEHQDEYRRQQQKERYDRLKAKGLCVRCGKPAASGNIRCIECIPKNKKRNAEYYRAHPEEAKERARLSLEKRGAAK